MSLCLCAINWKPNNHDTVHVYRKRVTTRRLRGCVSAPIVLSRRTAATTVRTATTRFSFFFALLHRMKTEREMYREVHCERITFNNDGDDTTFIVFAYFLFILKIVCFFITLIVCALMLFCFRQESAFLAALRSTYCNLLKNYQVSSVSGSCCCCCYFFTLTPK